MSTYCGFVQLTVSIYIVNEIQIGGMLNYIFNMVLLEITDCCENILIIP